MRKTQRLSRYERTRCEAHNSNIEFGMIVIALAAFLFFAGYITSIIPQDYQRIETEHVTTSN